MSPIKMTPLALALTTLVCSAAVSAEDTTQTLAPVTVKEKRSQDDTRPKLQHIMKEVDGPLITVTKKTSITKLDNIPTVVDNNLRELFAQTPGLFLSEQQTASQFNLSYRGIGNPQESEFVSVMQDGIPLQGDWIGFPTLYYLPLPQSVAELQMIRGGSSLLYGPEPGPALNFISRKPDADRPFGGYSENVIGNNGLFASFNRISGTVGEWDYLLDAHYRTNDGQRDNAGAILKGADFHLGYAPNDRSRWTLDFHGYELAAGEPGKYGYPVFARDPDFSPTPFNKDWVDRYVLVLGNEQKIGDATTWTTKVWRGYQDQTARTTGAVADVPNPVYPTLATLQDTTFRFTGIDSRVVSRWGRGNALTAGFVYYTSDSPLRQFDTTDLFDDRYARFDTVCAKTTSPDCVKLSQDRGTDYAAVFAENVFRWGEWHLVPSVRLERENVDIDENVHVRNAPFNTIPLADRSVDHTVPLLGLGFGNDFGRGNETYFNVSQGWRPVRYFDVGSPFGNLVPSQQNDPSPTHVLSWEAGVHGTPRPGLFYDVSVFWINVKDRIESQQAPGQPTGNTINVNTGDTRHRGFEGQVDYDFLAAADPQTSTHLSLFASVSLLNAEFTSSQTNLGNTPAFSPHYLARTGVVYREDKRLKLAVSLVSVASQFGQDSNKPFGTAGTDSFIPAKVPQYTVADFSGDWYVLPQLRLLAGVSNLTDRKYYNRIFSNGIEPGLRRTYYGGFAYEF